MPVFAYEAVDVETEQSSQRAVTGGVAASASTAADGGDARERTTPDDHARGMNFRGGSFRGNFRGVSGTVVADTPRQARDQLRARGLTVQVIRPVRGGSGSGGGWGPSGGGLLRKGGRAPGGWGGAGGGGGGRRFRGGATGAGVA